MKREKFPRKRFFNCAWRAWVQFIDFQPTNFCWCMCIESSLRPTRKKYFCEKTICFSFVSILNPKRWPSSRSHFVAISLSCCVLLVTLDLFMYMRNFYAFHAVFSSRVASVTRPVDGRNHCKRSTLMKCSARKRTGEGNIDCEQRTATSRRNSLALFLNSGKQPDTLSNAINSCVQLISVSLCPLDAWTLVCYALDSCQLNLWSQTAQVNSSMTK